MLRRIVAAGDVITNRELNETDATWRPFQADVQHNGIQVPILVDEDLNLIDGLRRLQSIDPLTEIEVMVAETFEGAVDYLESIKDSANWTPRRIWELFQDTAQLRVKYSNRFRGNKYTTNRRGRAPRKNHTRGMLARATGRTEHWIQCVTFIYSRVRGDMFVSEEWMPLLRDLVHDLDNSGNPYTAMKIFDKARSAKEARILSEGEQRLTLTRSIAALRGVVHSINDIGTIHTRIKPEEAARYAGEIRDIRSDLYDIQRKLTERTKR